MATGVYTDIELIVIRWLERHKIQFEAQSSLMGGFYALGGAVVDFIILAEMLAWRVQGEYYHKGVTKEGTDIIQKEILDGLGYTTVDIWGDDIKTRADQTLRLALQGQEQLR